MAGETPTPQASGSGSTSVGISRWDPGPSKISNPVLLRSDNYPLWRLETVIHLTTANVWDVVSGSNTAPQIDYHHNWKRANNQARSLLIQLVSEEFKGIIGNHENSADAWKAIEDTLDRRSVTSTIHPINQIFDYKKSASSS